MKKTLITLLGIVLCGAAVAVEKPAGATMEQYVDALMRRMTLEEKIGQMCQLTAGVVIDQSDPQHPVLSEALLDTVLGKLATEDTPAYTVLEKYVGRDLEYKEYEPLFACAGKKAAEQNKKAHFVTCDTYVTLTDGTGGMYLLQTVTAVYLRLLGHEISNGGFVLDVNETPDPEEFEDAYMRYANARVCPPRPAEKTYRVRGKKEPFYTLNVIDGIMSVSAVQKVAKQYQASITEYLNAVLLYSLLQKQEHDFHLRLRPVRIAMPVNLRRFFPSKTLRNFITMVYPSIDPRLGDYTFEEIVTQVHHYMRYYINSKFLRGDITTNASTQRNPLIRIVPLFLKDFVVRQFYQRVQDKNSSAGLTNMGAIRVPDDMKPYLERFDI